MRGGTVGRRQHLVVVVPGLCSCCARVEQSGPVRQLPILAGIIVGAATPWATREAHS